METADLISFYLRVGCSGCDIVLARVEHLLSTYPGAEIGGRIYIDADEHELRAVYPRLAEHAQIGFAGPIVKAGSQPLPAAVRKTAEGRTEWLSGAPALLALVPEPIEGF